MRGGSASGLADSLLVFGIAGMGGAAATGWLTDGMGPRAADTITVRLERRAYSPVLRKASLPAGTRIPWLGNRAINYEFS
jgi:hypothetical protein